MSVLQGVAMVMCDDPLVVLGYGRGHAVFRDPREREVVAAVVVSAGLLMLGVVQQLPGKHGFHLQEWMGTAGITTGVTEVVVVSGLGGEIEGGLYCKCYV